MWCVCVCVICCVSGKVKITQELILIKVYWRSFSYRYGTWYCLRCVEVVVCVLKLFLLVLTLTILSTNPLEILLVLDIDKIGV